MTDKELIEEYDRLQGRMMHFYAAEGSSWSKESNERTEAEHQLYHVENEMAERGIKAEGYFRHFTFTKNGVEI